ncbi:cache domain-containing protein [Azorhizobium doebereinerae]|uniref:cache domain-containing protein n=1 Tax=Azorhizobium doebereinerae TaxID=281091 RepID=UPI0003FE9AF5|nr:cache domain-containing protein [Azorhizobium doebereinerae]
MRAGLRAEPRGRLIGILLLGLALAGLAAALVLADRAAEMQRARSRVASHVTAVTEHLAAVQRGIELALDRMALKVEGRALAEMRADPGLHQLLAELRGRLPNVESAFVVDADGRTLASSRAFPMPPYDVRERDYFIAARDGPGGLHVSKPFRGQMSRTTSFVISRPLTREGRFAGLVAVTVFPEALTATYQDMLGHADMVLARADGVVLIRTEGARAVERLQEQAEVMERVAGQDGGLFVGPSIIDGERALHGVRRLPGGGLLVAVVLDEDEILGGWERRTAMIAGGAVLAFAGLSAWAVALPRQRPWWRLPPRRARGHRRLPQDLPAGGLALLDLLAGRVRARLAIGDPAGADAAARLIGALLAMARDDPSAQRPVDMAGLVGHVRGVLAGAALPEIAVAPAAGPPALVRGEAARLELALIDLAMGLSALAPDAGGLAASVTAGPPEGWERADLPAGDYVRLRLDVVEEHGAPGVAGSAAPEAFVLAQGVARASGGACVVPAAAAGRPLRAELWLPRAPDAAEPPAG